jgi:cytochrome c peroxidase
MATLALDQKLARTLQNAGYTGRISEQLARRLGRPVSEPLANLGRALFFDTILGIHNDNSCAGCHSPLRGFGDTQPIAIGVDNNGIVGPGRTGPRNERRAPSVLNTAFYPRLMWNTRFESLSGDPFNNRKGFRFPDPEADTLSYLPHLLTAQAFLPVTSQYEMAGFDLFLEDQHNEMRAELVKRLNGIANYKLLFGQLFPQVRAGKPITYDMVGTAIAEFEFTLTRANAPLDRFARGNRGAMTIAQKQGALLFFGKAGCVACHQVRGQANEMFSDFQNHNIGVPQVHPLPTNTNFDDFDGPGQNEDYGRANVTGKAEDRYKFRTSPLRNVGLNPFFFHNGAFDRLDDAIAHHLDARRSALSYTTAGRLPDDVIGPTADVTADVLAGLESPTLLPQPIVLTRGEFHDLVDFVRCGLLDADAKPQKLAALIPSSVPSGRPVLTFSELRVPSGSTPINTARARRASRK